MAPGRRRGAKGAKSKSELNLGDLVLAKVKGHPAWPAKISRPEDWEKAPDPKKCFVHFFGTNEIAFVLPADIQAFTIEAKNKVLARCKGKTVKYFAKAVKEICEEFEELQQKSSSGTGTDTDKHDSESEGPSIHGMDDDAKVTGPQGDTEMKALEDEGCVLGRCSRSQEGDASGGGEADGSSPASMSGQKEVTNGNKSKKIIPGSKRKLEGDIQSEKNTGAVGSLRRDKIHLEGADDRWKDTKGTFKEKVGRNVNPVKRSNSEDVAVDLAKGSVQRNRESGVLDSKAGDAKNRLPPRATAGSFDTNAAPSDDSVLQPAKRRRQDSMAGSSTRSSIDKTGKGFTALRNDSKKIKSPPVSQFPPKRRAVRLYDDDDEEEPKTPVHGGSFRKADAPSRVLDSVKSTSAHGERSIHEQAPGAHEDGSSKVLASSTVKPLSESLSPSSRQHVVRPKRASTLATYVSSSPEKIESDKMSSDEAGPVLVSPMRSPLAVGVAKPVVDPIRVNKTPVKVSDNVSQRKTHSGANKNTHVVSEPVLDLPMRSPLSVAVAKPVVELVRVNKPPVRVSDNISQRKSQPGANKNTLVVSDGLDHSPNHGLNERSKGVFSVEGQKNTPKSSWRMNDSALVAGKLTEMNSSTGERLQRDKKSGREDKTSVLTDSKIEDSAMSMKHLIAVAQARRKEAHSQSVLFHGSDVTGGSPILVSNSVQSILLSGGANSMMMQPDMQGNYQAQTSFPTSPASHIHHFSSNNNHPETEEFEDRRVSSGHRSTAGGSLSGGTEAAVARDAFEGMIETLSRTKESIGRATRLAIDCAKYGIANEVVELLIRKLETEPSLHRKVDLFFLVDSITQCSHGQKGIAGASYIPTVQAALPRLLGAAAPPGTVARENRKQCLKVLRLWLERKILPESLLRHYIDDIGVSNDDTSSAGVFLRRPSRAERAIDDPVREMDGMLVDEYGSNSTSQLLGLLSSRVFDEEEEEEEQKQDLSRDLCKVDGDGSAVEPTCTVGETEEFAVTPSDSRRHCILQDVDGELEMEDVSTHPKDERGFSAGLNFEMVSEGEGQGRIFEEGQNSFTELTPPQEDSPPLPLDSPPPTPPLPSSPPPPSPPPPPPLSPSPPPPPPPPLPSQAHMHPPPPAGMPLSLVPQPPTVPHHIHPFQSSLPSSSPSLAYQPLAPPIGSQTVQVAGNAPRGPHIDVNMRNGMFPQPPAFFVPSGPSGYNNSARPAVDYVVRNDLYANPQTSQPNQQQFQPGLPPLTQRPPFHPAPPPQAPSSQFSYSKPTTVQQIPQQQPYPPQYSVVPTHPDGTNWRMPANEFSSTDNQHGLWINGGRNSSGSVPSFPQEGYFRPPLNRPPSNNLSFQPPPERPPSNNASFQPPAVNTLPAGPPIPAAGHVGPQMVPIRPDFSTLGSWRPA